MVSSGELATQQALQQFESLGTNLMAVNLYQMEEGSNHSESLTAQQASDIKTANTTIELVAPYTSIFSNVVFMGEAVNAGIVGVTASLEKVININLQEGRFISPLDIDAFFCVIGQNLYNEIKPRILGSVIGKQILLGKDYFTIIGVMQHWPQNSFFNQDVNNSIFVPIKTSTLLSKYAQINSIIMTLEKDADINDVEKSIREYLNVVDAKDKLFFRSAKQLISSMKNQKQILTLFLGLIGSISLLVGGIGVMNIMLVSVVERRREIGIRRAVGARRRDIQKMFLLEAIILALLGGILGVFVGVGTSFIIASFAKWTFTIFLLPPLIGFTVSVLTGVFFGFYPAYQASRLNPIQTLHAE
jgi:putative ABC transport system permease protein